MKSIFEQQGGTYLVQGDYRLPNVIPPTEEQAQDLFSRLVKEYAGKEGITEQLKATDQMKWVQKMNSIRECVMEIINCELITT